MKCAWKSFVRLLPPYLRDQVDKMGESTLQELHLRVGLPPILITSRGMQRINTPSTLEDIQYVVNAASQYSPWSAETVANGYITVEGGHRVGLCGTVIVQSGSMIGFRRVTSACLRVARDFPGIAEKAKDLTGSVLILGRPGSGKTTLLRDLIRYRSRSEHGSIVVVDERCEIFPSFSGRMCFETGAHTDVLSGCSKRHGIELAIRTMGAGCVAVDEISSETDCDAIRNAAWCGVPILATAHASDVQDLMKRTVYKPLAQQRVFDSILVMQDNKTWKEAQMRLCT